MQSESIGLVNTLLDMVNSMGFETAVFRSHNDEDWCEIQVWRPDGRFIRVESDDWYLAACEVAYLAGVDLMDG